MREYQTREKGLVDVARQKACTPIVIGRQLVIESHQATYLKATQTTELLRPRYYTSQLESCQGHYFRVCHLCTGKPQRKGKSSGWGPGPGTLLKSNQLPLDTSTSWCMRTPWDEKNPSPTMTETASIITEKLLHG